MAAASYRRDAYVYCSIVQEAICIAHPLTDKTIRRTQTSPQSLSGSENVRTAVTLPALPGTSSSHSSVDADHARPLRSASFVHHPLPHQTLQSRCASPISMPGVRAPPSSARIDGLPAPTAPKSPRKALTAVADSLADDAHTLVLKNPSSSSDTEDGDARHQIASLVDVCPECMQLLFQAYNHCIAGKKTLFASPHTIREEQDARILTRPPDYVVVAEPKIREADPDMVDPAERVAYERRAHRHAREQTQLEQNTVHAGASPQRRTRQASEQQRPGELPRTRARTRTVDGTDAAEAQPNGDGDAFSGLLYRQMIGSKNAEIDRLRMKLFASETAEHREADNVQRLQKALRHSLKYYTQAEHWQEQESSRLVADVRVLKAEISMLMAVMINEETQKQQVVAELRQVRRQMDEKDQAMQQQTQEMETLKARLHETYKEFLTMNDNIQTLRKEASEGSDVVKNKNDVLQSNLDQVSRDFDAVSRRLIQAQDRIRLLEFELKEVVGQFNETGDAKFKLENNYKALSVQHESVVTRANYMESTYSQVVNQRDQLERDLRDANEAHSAARQAFGTQLDGLTKSLDTERAQKADLESQLDLQRGENEKLRSNVIELRVNKTELESTVQKLRDTHTSEMAHVNKQMDQYKAVASSATEQLHQIADSKEKLLLQVTDLRNNLEREHARATQLDIDLKRHKKASADKTADLEEQLAKLTTARNGLAADKKELMDSLKEARRDYILKKNEYTDLETAMEELRQTKETEISGLQAIIQSLRDSLAKLTAQHNSLTAVHKQLNVDHQQLGERLRQTQASLDDSRKTVAAHEATIDTLRTEKAAVEDERELLRKQLYEKTMHCDKVTAKLRETERLRDQVVSELTTSLQRKEEVLRDLSTKHTSLRESHKELQKQYEQHQHVHAATLRDLKLSRDALLEESASRSILEMTTDELRTRFENEKKTRLEFERMQVKLERKVGEWVNQRLEVWTDRERVWDGVEDWVGKELGRMDDVISILGIREGVDT
ncbi:hypothetical protein RI367_003352 [Sorochytrium milnesiophthora]